MLALHGLMYNTKGFELKYPSVCDGLGTEQLIQECKDQAITNTAKTFDDCKNVLSQTFNNVCVEKVSYKLITTAKTFDQCATIPDKHSDMRNDCNYFVSSKYLMNAKTATDCETIKSDVYKKACNAVISKDANQCLTLSDSNAELWCVIGVAKETSISTCEKLESAESKDQCKDYLTYFI